MLTNSGANMCLNKMLRSDFPSTTQFSRICMLSFRKLHIFAVSLFITLANKKTFFEKKSKLSYTLERNCAPITILPSDSPETTPFSRDYVFKIRKFSIYVTSMKILIYISSWKKKYYTWFSYKQIFEAQLFLSEKNCIF